MNMTKCYSTKQYEFNHPQFPGAIASLDNCIADALHALKSMQCNLNALSPLAYYFAGIQYTHTHQVGVKEIMTGRENEEQYPS